MSASIRARRRGTQIGYQTANPRPPQPPAVQARDAPGLSKTRKTPIAADSPNRAAPTQAHHCSCRMILDSSGTHWSADACSGRRPVDMASLMLVTVGDPEGFLRSLALIQRLSQMRTGHREPGYGLDRHDLR